MKVEVKKTWRVVVLVNFLIINLSLQLFNSKQTTLYAQEIADWTVLVYAQANNSLYEYANKNFIDMASIGSTKNVNILVEYRQPNHQGGWRYQIENGQMVFDSCVALDSDGNNPQDLINSVRWAVTKCPAKKFSLVLWDHGCGILDPFWGRHQAWGNKSHFIDPEMVKNNPRIQISGITTEADDIRGILFNEQSKTYMTNEQLTTALAQIKNSVLGGKKIDLLGMDACLMAMIEIGYQAKDYADILVSSEEVELARGWDYGSFLQLLKNDTLSPAQLAQGIVLTYDLYYKNRIQFYTQSAINLNAIAAVKQGLDNVVTLAKKCKDIRSVIKKSRSHCLQFSAASYIDLYSFLEEFHKNLVASSKHNSSVSDLKKAINSCLTLIDGTIIAHAGGKNMSRAKGLSIYFPTSGIDTSYAKTDFAKESLWMNFLHDLSA